MIVRRSTLLLLASTALAFPVVAQDAAPSQNPGSVRSGSYELDPAHGRVTWSVNHLGFSMLSGQFGASGGQAVIDPARPAATKLDVTFDVGDMSVTSAPFATHLKSADFFDVAKHPTARFVSRSVAMRGTGGTVTGDLTIKGITRPVTLNVTFVGAGVSPRGGKTNFGFRATGAIKRSDFGLGMAAPAVSDRVNLEVNAAFEAV